MPTVTLRSAHPREADALARLKTRSKASHGYDPATMAIFAPGLIVTEADVTRGWVVVAERGGDLVGYARVERLDDPATVWLEDLFVTPDSQRQGVGTLLWSAAVAHARAVGAAELQFSADPHAVAFYERLGATVTSVAPSTYIPTLTKATMRYAIPGPPAVTLRRAIPADADALTRIMVRAKASHGYDAETMRTFAPSLIVSADHIARNWVLIAERGEAPLGFVHIERRDDPAVAWLEDLFVDPDAQDQGVGTLLWRAALDHARALGATELRFDADPNATAFYERLGATVIGSTPSTLIPGRTMPLMRFLIGGEAEADSG